MATTRSKAGVNGRSKIEDSVDRKGRGAMGYPPYVNAYNGIPKLFSEISRASVPPKVTLDFLGSVLGLASSSHRALIPFMKRLGFIDAANVPTEVYRQYRDPEQRGAVMAAQVRAAYSELYRANEYAHTLKKEELVSKLRALLGASEDDPNIGAVVSSFLELVKLSDFDAEAPGRSRDVDRISSPPEGAIEARAASHRSRGDIGLSYTINLNLPATTEIEVFNAIFRSLKEHLLDA